MLVEDDADSRQVMAEILAMAGHEVFEAGDGVEALSIARTQRVEVAVTDIVMPRKDGLETIEELRRSFPNVRIIALSGSVEPVGGRNRLSAAGDFGAHVVLRKPIDLVDLLEAVTRLVAVCEVAEREPRSVH